MATSDRWQVDGPADAPLTFVCAHGAGAPMDSPFLAAFAAGVAAAGFRVVRFEFDYMHKRRMDGRKRGPERMPALQATWLDVCAQIRGPFVMGGKSMGGRVASMVADQTEACGLICLGYPFHPPRKPEKLRTEHLASLRCKTLIIQGTRDPMGTPDDVATYELSQAIGVHWIEDGDHSLVPRKRSGRTPEQNWGEAIDEIVRFCRRILAPTSG